MLMIACVLMLVCAGLLSSRTRVLQLLHGTEQPRENPFFEDDALRSELVRLGPEGMVQRMQSRVVLASVMLYAILVPVVVLLLWGADGVEPSTGFVMRMFVVVACAVLLVRGTIRYRRTRRATRRIRRKASLRCFAEEALVQVKTLPESQTRGN